MSGTISAAAHHSTGNVCLEIREIPEALPGYELQGLVRFSAPICLLGGAELASLSYSRAVSHHVAGFSQPVECGNCRCCSFLTNTGLG